MCCGGRMWVQNQQSNIVAIDINTVKSRMLQVRGQQVLLDRDVAALYGVETRIINQAVKNNPEKFPAGYVAELTAQEVEVLRSKILTLETWTENVDNGCGRMNRKRLLR